MLPALLTVPASYPSLHLVGHCFELCQSRLLHLSMQVELVLHSLCHLEESHLQPQETFCTLQDACTATHVVAETMCAMGSLLNATHATYAVPLVQSSLPRMTVRKHANSLTSKELPTSQTQSVMRRHRLFQQVQSTCLQWRQASCCHEHS